MKKYAYDFSVIMSVYNVEAFIREAIESLERQTIGFTRIQLILVDDGSTDKSGKICDEYKTKHPDNVLVVHKENGGLSSSRNTALPFVKGQYVSFFDPDDTLSSDTFQRVFIFMEEHPEIDVSCIPFFFFGNQSGPHQLNNKFELGTRVIELSEDENAAFILLSSATAFYRKKAAEKLHFDTEIYTAEDAKANLRLFMDNPRLGVVAEARYNYRKHGNSILDKTKTTRAWYITNLQRFSKWALDTAEQKFGYIPKFVQHTVMYDLQWKLQQGKVPDGVLNEQEEKEYYKLLIDMVCRIDDDVILQQKSIWIDMKLYLLGRKYGTGPELKLVSGKDHKLDIELWFGGSAVDTISKMKTVLEFIRIDRKNNVCILEGYHIVCGIKKANVKPCLLINGKTVPCEIINRDRKATKFHEEKINEIIGFRGTVTLTERALNIGTALLVGKALVKRNNHKPGPFFPVCTSYRNAYCLKHDRMITMEKTHLSVRKKPLLPMRFLRECLLSAEIWRKNCLGGRKAVGGRLFYHLMKLFKKRRLWIVSDRIMKADDNGEALFRYLQKNPPENTRVVFAVSKKSADYERMRKVGECVDAMSFRHKLLHLLCDVNISSHADAVTVNPYDGHHDALRDLLTHQHFVFLQHGITKDDISGWLNRYNKDISGFITAAYREHESIVNGNYGYPASRVWLTGFPRYDRLYHREKNVVTVMPTWRRYLMGRVDSKSGKWIMGKEFKQSSYFQFYNRLLNSPRLLSSLEARNCSLQFFPHPNIQTVQDWFQHDPRVIFLPYDTSYREVYAESRLVITDYSSAVFDFAYLRKPVIYCQFDSDLFFAGEHVYEKGYFDYERDGFGEVTYDIEALTDLIIHYADNSFKLKDVYKKRIDSFFAFHDQDSCRRVTERILALPEKR
ncbi:MAG: CDP-glycerol glycerophosphotransferase family protein [Stomatobaculum sp.]|nr:CDP-glycerol glycerophosphotransferase family protein [Stomatobaculum sp.]